MKIRLRKKQKKIVVAMLLFISVASGIGTFVLIQKREYQNQINAEQSKNDKIVKSILVPKEDIKQGTRLMENMFETDNISFSLDTDMLISSKDFGKFAKTDLIAYQPVLDTQVYETKIDDSVRIEQFNMFMLQPDLKEHHTVDVRIALPNGENYLILSKKKIEKLDKENNILWLALDEEEISLISSAIVDGYITGSKIYVNRFVDSEVQESLTPNYIPRKDVLELLEENVNLSVDRTYLDTMNARRNLLDKRLNVQPDEEKAKVESGVQEEKQNNDNVVFENLEEGDDDE